MSTGHTAIFRRKLADAIGRLSEAPSWIYVINADAPDGVSLRCRLGMESHDYEAMLVGAGLATIDYYDDDQTLLSYSRNGWETFVAGHNFSFMLHPDMPERPELNKNQFDMSNKLNGTPRDPKKRRWWHTIRIGRKGKGASSARHILEQVDDRRRLDTNPPPLAGLSQIQRVFTGSMAKLVVESVKLDGNELLWDRYTKQMDDTNKKRTRTTTYIKAPRKSSGSEDRLRSPQKKKNRPGEQTQAQSDHATAKEGAAKEADQVLFGLKEAAAQAGLDVSAEVVVEEIPLENIDESADESADGSGVNYSDQFPILCKVAKALDCNIDEDFIDDLLVELVKLRKRGTKLQYKCNKSHRTISYVHVPVNTTDKSFHQQKQWLEDALEINGSKNDQHEEAYRRAAEFLAKKEEAAVIKGLQKVGLPVVEAMSATKMVAMCRDVDLPVGKEEVVFRHLRDHFGKKAFDGKRAMRMLGDDYVPVKAKHAMHSYVEGEKEEKIHFSYKDIKLAVTRAITERLRALSGQHGWEKLKKIKRTDIMNGGDHGGGAFQAGCNICVSFEDDDVPSQIFDLCLAEVVCRKDNAEILGKTIIPIFEEALKEITEKNLTVGLNKDGEIECVIGNGEAEGLTDKVCVTKIIYIIGDLAYYAMILGRENSSGHWCYICKLSAKEYAHLYKEGDPMTYEFMNECAKDYKDSKGKDCKYGVKARAWFQFIPLENILCPLLHLLIGIGNDILDNFKDVVNRDVEKLDPREVTTRQKFVQCELAISRDVARREEFDASVPGKELSRLKGVIYRRTKALAKLGEIEQSSRRGASSKDDTDVLLDEIDDYVENDEVVDGEDDEDQAQPPSEPNRGTQTTNPRLQEAIAKNKEELKKAEDEAKQLIEKREKIATEVTKGRSLLRRLKKKLTDFRSTRKRSKNGIEAKMLKVLKSIGVEVTKYHGGSLTGKDIRKVIANASYVFDEFAKILKEDRKADGLSETEIDKLCEDHKLTFLLWDGAFSTARTIDPTEGDIVLYEKFVYAAVVSHISIGCSVTHKVHLMYKHVAVHMRVPGGLGQKMEDWVELQHQGGMRERTQYRTMGDMQKAAEARERRRCEASNTGVIEVQTGVHERAKRKFKEKSRHVEEVRREERELHRKLALIRFNLSMIPIVRLLKRWTAATRARLSGTTDDTE